ncbi:2'-5' RNA ligase family protein [Paraflavitalea sp. CAU 1676]|uniref:2'-5' RNA ligase family protein n=1 Tax=Paraflavitalea sp. CAU 1676 TaxID=3032598 RepID=UPI0023DC9B94|nr:2'-5' RNA ligase family protein [Paraflavitalea sp. CAU 1676]MDF2187035.1 2'-5' RNA ligase family protein [Paraflavitalea sp. CAU 1676]
MEPVKNNSTQSWAEYGLYEYLLVADPDPVVQDKVLAQKQEFCEEYCDQSAIKTGSHIVVASFLAREAMEDTLIRWIQRICDQLQPFRVTLNNYSGFPPHTIYLRVQDPIPFLHLSQKLKAVDDLVRSSSCPPVRLIGKPHLSIAKRLPEPVYTKAMFNYSQKTFHESFMVHELRLLRRAHQFDTSKMVNKFPFAPGSQPWSEVA